MTPSEEDLATTYFIDRDDKRVQDFADKAAADARDPIEIARNLFHAVRDGWRYDPYVVQNDKSAFRASHIVTTDSNWCVPKSIILTAAARHCGIPARLGFADVRNHLTSEKLSESMGTDVFAWHGYSELFLNGRWVKLSTAFNKELCEKFGVKVLEFDPVNGALMHAFDTRGQKHMEYIRERGSYADLPLDEMLATFKEVYPSWRDGEFDNQNAERDTAFDA